VSGDLYLVAPHPRGLLIGVVDGLGHGHEAAAAAATALTTLERAPHQPVLQLIELCHEVLRSTRSVVMSLASLDKYDQMMSWIAVGNVKGFLLRAGKSSPALREYILMRGGIVGHRLPPLQVGTVPIGPSDLLIFPTDGIGSGFEGSVNPFAPPQAVADAILPRYGVPTDDALVLVGRWNGCQDGQ
jgi:serine phosphatase RsbU (regulator of sigma subunit)